MLSEILKKISFGDLLTASKVSKYWRDVAAPIIANSFILPIKTKSMQKATKILRRLTIGYKHMVFSVSFSKFFNEATLLSELYKNINSFCAD